MNTFAAKTKNSESESAKFNGIKRKSNDLKFDSLSEPVSLFGFPIQRKADCACGGDCPSCQSSGSNFSISHPGDASEIEADQIADKVMRESINEPIYFSALNNKIGRKPVKSGRDGNPHEENNALDLFASPIMREIQNSGVKPLDSNTQTFMESRFNYNFGDVRIYDNETAAESADSIDALAYTSGKNIVFNSGQYNTSSDSGKRLLAHELTHVIQQETNNHQRYGIQKSPKPKNQPPVVTENNTKTIKAVWNHNLSPFVDSIVDGLKAQTGLDFNAKEQIPHFRSFENKILLVHRQLNGLNPRVEFGSPVEIKIEKKETDKKCPWQKLYDCDYRIYSDHKTVETDENIQARKKGYQYGKKTKDELQRFIFTELAHCLQGSAIFVYSENIFAVHFLKWTEYPSGIPWYPTTAEMKQLDSAMELAIEEPDASRSFTVDRRQTANNQEDVVASSDPCANLEPGLKDACEINRDHRLAASQAAEGLKSATCYGGKLDMALCIAPVVGGVRSVSKAGDFAHDLKNLNNERTVAKIADEANEIIKPLERVTYKIKDAPFPPIPGGRQTGIDRAWRQEVELVNKFGQGSRNWTKAEIEQIKKGADYGDLGYTGHHINRVKDYPEWKGDPRNIEFYRQGAGEEHMTAGHPGGTRAVQPEKELIDREAMLKK